MKEMISMRASIKIGANELIARQTVGGHIATTLVKNGRRGRQLIVTDRYPRRRGESWDDPVLIKGPDGQPWLFYKSNARRFTYYHRWLGEDWSQRYDGRGFYFVDPSCDNHFDENLLPIDGFAVKKNKENDVVISLTSKVFDSFETQEHVVAKPDLKILKEEGCLFVDTAYVSQTENLEWICETAKKHPANPVFKHGKKGMPDQQAVLNHGTVIKSDGKFRMWYTGYERPGDGVNPRGLNWTEYLNICYAESNDGINWIRPRLGLVEYLGNKNNNKLPAYYSPAVVEDKNDPDPSRRFKMVEQFGLEALGRLQHVHLHTSPDGIHWKTQRGRRIYPGTRPWWFHYISFFRDISETDPNKRWKAYGSFATGPKRRTCGMATSPDCLAWTGYPDNPIIDPLQGVRTHIHDLVIWRESGLYLGLVQVRDELCNYDVELVISRDGIRFSRVKDGLKFIKRGKRTDWDAGLITMSAAPVFVKDETWFYYGARESAYTGKDNIEREWHANRTNAGIAIIGRGRYAAFAVKNRNAAGLLTTVPLKNVPVGNLRLFLNARSDAGNPIRVAVVDAVSRRIIRRFDDCRPVIEDGISVPVRWNEANRGMGSHENARLVFELNGQAKLYGFRFHEE